MVNHPPGLAYARAHGLPLPPVPGMSKYELIHGEPDPRPARNLTSYISRTPPSPGFELKIAQKQKKDGSDDDELPDWRNILGAVRGSECDGEQNSDDSLRNLFHSDGSDSKVSSSPPRLDAPRDDCVSDSFDGPYYESVGEQMAVKHDSEDPTSELKGLEAYVASSENKTTEYDEDQLHAADEHAIEIQQLKEKVKMLEKENEQLKAKNEFLGKQYQRLCENNTMYQFSANPSGKREDVKLRHSSLREYRQDSLVKSPMHDALPERPASADRKRKPKSPVTVEVETPAKRTPKKLRKL
ncbi:hypothetical protein BU16DRAFT_539840 [Lophium mytilinum]|uniref:Uncharacterized protein n=1 Tax=Lophium mytilinum TaxID=390894 RepID=A0A6A6QQW5_9PEZI|nr:hypothetical protein BU16DRAFT_539840 [Lophium mytilinum]